MAATKGDVAIVRALLDMGADPLVENLVRPCAGVLVACERVGLVAVAQVTVYTVHICFVWNT